MPQDLDQYISWVIEQKPELKGVDSDVIAQLKSDLADRLEDQINAALVAALPKDRLGDLERLIESGTTEQIQDYCKQHIPAYEEVIAAVLVRFKVSYLGF
jgi:hypothetical protein